MTYDNDGISMGYGVLCRIEPAHCARDRHWTRPDRGMGWGLVARCGVRMRKIHVCTNDLPTGRLLREIEQSPGHGADCFVGVNNRPARACDISSHPPGLRLKGPRIGHIVRLSAVRGVAAPETLNRKEGNRHGQHCKQ